MRIQPTLVTIQTILILLLVVIQSGCDRDDTAAGPDDVEPGMSNDRLAEIADDSDPSPDAGELKFVGMVVELLPAAIRIKNEEHPDGITLATADDLKVYTESDEIDRSAIEPGSDVTIYSEQRGNRADGWQSLVVRIKTDAVSPAGEKDTLVDSPGQSTKLTGTFVKADAASVTIRSGEELSVMPTDDTVIVRKSGQSGGTELLTEGDDLELTFERRGNRADGWISVITDISVVDEDRSLSD